MPNTMVERDARGVDYDVRNFRLPADVNEVCALVRDARPGGATPGRRIRVRGSSHSVADAVYTDAFSPSEGPEPSAAAVNLLLDNLMRFDVEADRIIVGAGMHIGPDPFSRGAPRDPRNSLVHRLHAEGLALPILGGITHQSLGGFVSTGSAGGSLQHDFTDAICALSLVTGTGELVRLERAHPDFEAALVSMGLLGIIVEVELARASGLAPEPLPPAYDVEMTSEVMELARWGIDPFAEGALARFFRDTEYARLLWWPQPGVEKVDVWTGRRTSAGHTPNPVPSMSRLEQWFAGWIYRNVFDTMEDLREELPWVDTRLDLDQLRSAISLAIRERPAGPGRPESRFLESMAGQLVEGLVDQLDELRVLDDDALRETLVATLINLFVKDHPRSDHVDVWFNALPQDNAMSDQIMPVIFTELWVDLERTHEVMQQLRELYAREGLDATGTMCVEIYGARQRASWLSPSHSVDVVRVDPFVFDADEGSLARARALFAKYWDLLAPLDYRCHWAKELAAPDSLSGVSHRRRVFPMLERFAERRAAYDPHGLFLTSYWMRHLGLG